MRKGTRLTHVNSTVMGSCGSSAVCVSAMVLTGLWIFASEQAHGLKLLRLCGRRCRSARVVAKAYLTVKLGSGAMGSLPTGRPARPASQGQPAQCEGCALCEIWK